MHAQAPSDAQAPVSRPCRWCRPSGGPPVPVSRPCCVRAGVPHRRRCSRDAPSAAEEPAASTRRRPVSGSRSSRAPFAAAAARRSRGRPGTGSAWWTPRSRTPGRSRSRSPSTIRSLFSFARQPATQVGSAARRRQIVADVLDERLAGALGLDGRQRGRAAGDHRLVLAARESVRRRRCIRSAGRTRSGTSRLPCAAAQRSLGRIALALRPAPSTGSSSSRRPARPGRSPGRCPLMLPPQPTSAIATRQKADPIRCDAHGALQLAIHVPARSA